MIKPGDRGGFIGEGLYALLRDVFAEAEEEVVLVAPFIKAPMLQRLLEPVQTSTRITVLTRWRLEELAAGVSDLEVMDVLRSRRNTRLLLQDRLHAKYFRGDERLLVGSANMTAAALMDGAGANLELLVRPAPELVQRLERWESAVVHSAIVATEEIRDWLQRRLGDRPDLPQSQSDEPLAPDWLPSLRYPADLWTYASGHGEELSSTARALAAQDLAALQLPLPMLRSTFYDSVAGRLLTSATVGAIVNFCSKERRFGEVCDFLGERFGLSRSQAQREWQVLMRWFREYLGGSVRYRRHSHSELITITLV